MDRNKVLGTVSTAERAWIEIPNAHVISEADIVALRKESVDRNIAITYNFYPLAPSLSARRAWIEIAFLRMAGGSLASRSPQGERG